MAISLMKVNDNNKAFVKKSELMRLKMHRSNSAEGKGLKKGLGVANI
jgi:hypothetical protein